jgi:hypothetical protein
VGQVGRVRGLAGAGRAALVVVFIAGALVVRSAESAGACDCAGTSPSVADVVGSAEVAFVGWLVSSERLDPPESELLDLRYELTVEEPVKGVETGDRVTMFGSTAMTSCGTSELDESLPMHAIVTGRSGDRFVADSTPFCGLAPTVEELRGVDLLLPPTSRGPVSLVVTGQLGWAEMVAYDAAGSPVSYGDAAPFSSRPVICPSSHRLVHFEQEAFDGPGVMVTRDVGTLAVLDRIALAGVAAGEPRSPFDVAGSELTCLAPNGDDALWTISPYQSLEASRFVRIRPESAGGVSEISQPGVTHATFDPRTTTLVAVADGALVRWRIDDLTAAEPIATVIDVADPPTAVVVITPDAGDGWWLGIGRADGGVATRLSTLTHVAGDGTTERWAVDPPVDVYSSAVVVDDQFFTATFRLPLPAAGSSVTGAVVTPVEESTEALAKRHLDDGREVRLIEAPESSSVEIVNVDGSITRLQHLNASTRVVAVPDGPTVDPATIRRTVDTGRVESPWIVPGVAVAADPPATPPATSPPTSPATSSVRADAGSVNSSSDAPDDGDNSTRPIAILALAGTATALIGAVSWATARRRRH